MGRFVIVAYRPKPGKAEVHTNVEVQKMWGEYAEVCDYVPLNQLPESANMFAEFASLN
jgi:hypothetical protein